MGTKKITEEVRLGLKRQAAEPGAEPDIESQVVSTGTHKGGLPGGARRTEGSGQPGGHGRGGKSSRH
jgi:hypothetical protein